MQKSIFFIFVIILFSLNLHAQIAVKSFLVLENDLDARVTAPIIDQNGDKCALIKIGTTETGFKFEAGMLGIMKAIKKTGEYWVYVPYGSKKITIKHDKLGILRNYIYPESIQEAMVYEMVLTTGRVITTVVEAEIESVWLMVESNPSEADLYIDDIYIGQTPFQKKLKKQKYNYRLSKAKYQPDAGVLDLTNIEDKKLLEINLKPDFGSVYITTEPESDAEVILDDYNTGKTTPCTINEVKSGTHRITLRREWYEPVIKEFDLTAEENKTINVELVPSFGELKITSNPEADIFIDNQKKAYGQYSCRLSPGIYSIKSQKAKHHEDKKSIEIILGETKNISLNPQPQYGTLDIASTPWDAEITIDGNNYGKTPKTIKNFLVGTYAVKLNKSGYAPLTKTITIKEGQTENINIELPSGKQVTINSNPQGAKLYIDNEYKGATPITFELSFGNHKIKLTKDKQIIEETINISENGKTDYNFILQGSIEMVFVKGGCFNMGSNDGESDEKPVHEVCVDDFYIGKYEVTQKQWKEIMGTSTSLSNPSKFKGDYLPVEKVQWKNVQEFIKKLNQKTGKNYRLPTEAEWEYAARGGASTSSATATKYSGSNNIDNVAWHSGNSGEKTHVVGRKHANELGIYDMSGNVWEWCSDWYSGNYYKNSPRNNPQGESSGIYHVFRGGSRDTNATGCRIANRNRPNPFIWNYGRGFRIAQDN